MKLAGKRAVVTGGARGFGEAIVRRFAAEGASVFFVDLLQAEGEALAAELTADGKTVCFRQADVRDPAAVAAYIEEAAALFGGLDILVNNAGIEEPATILENEPLEVWEDLLRTDLFGVFYNAKYALPHLRASKGNIVSISSISGLVATKEDPAYNAAKHGVIGLTKSIARDYAALGVRANAVCPGCSDTHMMQEIMAPMSEEQIAASLPRWGGPMGRLGRPVEIANLVTFLASDEASYITGAACAVDGGYSAI